MAIAVEVLTVGEIGSPAHNVFEEQAIDA